MTNRFCSFARKRDIAMKILSIKDYSGKLRASVQMSGRFGFSEETAKVLQLQDRMSIKFAQDDDETLFCSFPDGEDADAFKVRKAGRYFYVPTDVLFSSLGIDYKKYNILFSLVRDPSKDEELNGKAYHMEMLPKTLRKKEEEKDDIEE